METQTDSYDPTSIMEKEFAFIEKYVPKDLADVFPRPLGIDKLDNTIIVKLIKEKQERTKWLTDNKLVKIQFFSNEKLEGSPLIAASGLFYLIKVFEDENATRLELSSYYLDKENDIEVSKFSEIKLNHKGIEIQSRKLAQLYFIDMLRRYSLVNGDVDVELGNGVKFLSCFSLLESNQPHKKLVFDEYGEINFENWIENK